MFFKSTIAAGIVALSALAVSAPAQAHSVTFGVHGSGGGFSYHSGGHGHGHWDRGYGHLTPWQVRRKLRHRGFTNMQFFDRRAPVYKLRATGRRGNRVMLVVSSRTGRIIERRRIDRRRHDRRRYH